MGFIEFRVVNMIQRKRKKGISDYHNVILRIGYQQQRL